MADITVTSTSVLAGSSQTQTGTAGAAITAGQPVYADAADSSQLKPADSDTEASAVAVGIALHSTGDGQPLKYLTSGDINPGGTVVVGEVYAVSTNAGGIAPVGDLTTGDYVTLLGVGTSATNIAVRINSSGAVKP